jgi:hypothetical protein
MSVQEGEKKERYQPHCQLEIKQRMNEWLQKFTETCEAGHVDEVCWAETQQQQGQ